MKEQEIRSRIAAAVEDATPDVLENILAACEKQKRKPRLWKKVGALAAAVVIVCGATLGYGAYQENRAVDSIIGIDVNPSLELYTNKNEKVLSVDALNKDAQIVLDGMNLEGVDLDVAVNALIGSMLKNGYVDELRNSILISVENGDSQRGKALQARLSKEVDRMLAAYSVEGAILSQCVPAEDERLKELAEKYQISLGKAALVDQVVKQDAKLTYESVAALSINDINLLAAAQNASLSGITAKGQASSQAYIGEEKAKSIALAHSGATSSEVVYEKARLDYDDGRMVYDVEFRDSQTEYEYEIGASDGKILSYERERYRSAPAGTDPVKPGASSDNQIFHDDYDDRYDDRYEDYDDHDDHDDHDDYDDDDDDRHDD